MQFGIIELWQHSGWLARLVVIILLLLSVWTIGVGIERLIVFSRAKKQSRKIAILAAKLLKEDKLKEALNLTSRKEYKGSHLAKVIFAGLQEYLAQSETNAKPAEKIESSKRSVERQISLTVQDFRKGLNPLATIGSTAPFIGLFGTVFGIINAFHGMSVTGSGGIGAVAAGIAEALITTGTGIGVAVVAVWFFNFLLNQIDIFVAEMNNASSELIGFFIQKEGV
ncbi:MAG: MotA/TolQ/ExbB proton channel family protein [Candidatus Aminicenantia bacterium]